MAGAVLRVPDEHLAIMLDPALATQDVVDAGCHLVPLKVVPKPERHRGREGSWLALRDKCNPEPESAHLAGYRSHAFGSGLGSAVQGDIFMKQSSFPRKYSTDHLHSLAELLSA